MNMKGIQPERKIEQRKSFRDMVGQLIEGHPFFPLVEIGNGQPKMSIIDALENDTLVTYVDLSGYGSKERLDAIHCLTVMYDESKKAIFEGNKFFDAMEELKQLLN